MARFRVILAGFTVHNQTWDHAWEVDGKADEVYVRADVRLTDVQGNILLQSEPRSQVMGDTNGFPPPARVQAGSASGMGGLRSGDSFPSTNPWQQQGALQMNRPPMLLFEGEVVQGQNAAVIIPSIWEWDGGTDMFNEWGQLLVTNGPAITAAVMDIINATQGTTLPSAVIKTSLEMGLPALFSLASGIMGQAKDRPIGMIAENNGYAFNAKMLVLTEATAELATITDFGRGPGVLEMNYKDDARLTGDYTLYLKVEKVPVVLPPSHSWESLGGRLTSGPGISSWGSGRLDVFVRGTDNALWHMAYNGGGWGSWEQLGPNPIASDPAAVSWGTNRIDVFVRGTDDQLYHKWWDGSWRP